MMNIKKRPSSLGGYAPIRQQKHNVSGAKNTA
jgi:hypothetical protein